MKVNWTHEFEHKAEGQDMKWLIKSNVNQYTKILLVSQRKWKKYYNKPKISTFQEDNIWYKLLQVENIKHSKPSYKYENLDKWATWASA